jgi:sulfide:quinone oxidoreductase
MRRVTVLGGGPAAAELLLALRAITDERIELELITPRRVLALRAASTGAAFGEGEVSVYDLAELAEETGATLRIDAAEAVAPAVRRIRLASGAATDYDALVLAVGARARSGVPGATVFRDQRDAGLLRALVEDLGELRSIAFTVPTGVAWTLPLYELALLAAAEAARRDAEVSISIVTPERRPLEVFGPRTGLLVGRILADRGVRVMLSTAAAGAARGRLVLRHGGSIPAERVIAAPRLVGRRIAGIPSDWNSFVHTDAHGRVPGLDEVFAAGDMTAFPIKQGGIAAQQADVIAAVLAGKPVPPVRHVLRTQLLGAGSPLYLRTELGGDGTVISEGPSDEPEWWPSGKLFGRHLSPWMARPKADRYERIMANS